VPPREWRHVRKMYSGVMDEGERVREVYARHSARWQETRYRGWMPGNLFLFQERERVMLNLLRRHGFLPLTHKRILDVGCGGGKPLMNFLRYGARPENLFGIDLLEHELEQARTIAPHLQFELADATSLPFEDGMFDLALAFTLFSSIQSRSRRRLVANEMLRVLRPSGAVLAYDFWITSRVNRDVQPIRRKEIRELFADCRIDVRAAGIAPPLARRLAPRFWLACELLARVPLLRTHWVAVITPKPTSGEVQLTSEDAPLNLDEG
jgi:ubiquinone/menaquinone biosynthesis C-methylase UbiE